MQYVFHGGILEIPDLKFSSPNSKSYQKNLNISLMLSVDGSKAVVERESVLGPLSSVKCSCHVLFFLSLKNRCGAILLL